ncbi:MAG TPA: hypothetical protein PK830_05835 [Candidatus Atribacteria bacterium]|nr:hypothetical protein [Candidatus Atribacteria bacterium]HPT78603.1 hypothetical protein [Candidatus Atribacteria bacterium]
MNIQNFSDFCDALLDCGFSMGGGSAKGIYAIIPYSWTEQDLVDSPVKWHTGDPGTDPWQWRMRVLEERDDIAYAKVFFRTSGYITREWYPYFYAVRRNGQSLEDAYESGTISHTAKRIYDIISQNGTAAYHEIKRLGGFHREENSSFERAVVDLQMGMFITICGRAQKTNKYGMGYGWDSTVFTTVEDFWASRGFTLPDHDPDESYERIRARILELNPDADDRKIARFIRG